MITTARHYDIPDVDLAEVIGHGTHSTVFRGLKAGCSYTVKVLELGSREVPAERLRQARRRLATLARLTHPSLARPIAVGTIGSALYVIREFVDGPTLDKVLERGPLPEPRVVAIGRALAEGLGQLHAAGLVHRDVKPQNVLLAKLGPVKLIDFELTVADDLARREMIVGTALYSPPEQTGMLPGGVDARSDLYALGSVLFECATGRAPYVTDDAAQVARLHLTAPVPDVLDLNPSVSPALGHIIVKLLAKSPEDRYQSSAGLLRDLHLLPTLNQLLIAGKQIALGTGDHPRAVGDGLLCLGRDRELTDLDSSWRAAVQERGGSVLLRGAAGSGKTQLAQAFAARVRTSGKLVLFASCDEREAQPFGAIRMAIDRWLTDLPSLAPAARAMAQKRLGIAAGDFGPVLKLFSPAFAEALPGEPPAAKYEVIQERSYDILTEFLLRLAGCYAGALLVIDDVQRLDDSSREILQRLALRLVHAPLLVLATARADPASRAAIKRVTEILRPTLHRQTRLEPLTQQLVGQLVAAKLGATYIAPDIARHIASWTNGNPLAIEEYLQTLIDAGVLRPDWGEWALDRDGLASLNLPGDVARLIAARVDRLAPDRRRVLQMAALAGSRLSSDFIHVLSEDDDTARRVVDEALQAQIIQPAGPVDFVFAHEEVRQALTAGLQPDELMALHQHIAGALERSADDDASRIYAMAHHYALGQTSQNARRIYDTSLAAGIKAAENFANAEAHTFLLQAQRAAALGAFSADAVLDEALGEVCARRGLWDAAETHLRSALANTTEPLRRAGLRARLARVYAANRQAEQAWAEVECGFIDLGRPIGHGRLGRAFYAMWCWLIGLLALRLRIGYGGAQGARRERLRMLSQLYVVGAYTAYLLQDKLRLVSMVVSQLYAGHLLGDSIELASAYTSYATLLAIAGRRSSAARWSQRSLVMVSALGDRFQLARMRMFEALQLHFVGDPIQSETHMRRCLEIDSTWLDAADLAYGHIDLAWNLSMRGYDREALGYLEEAAGRAQGPSGEITNLRIKAAAMLTVLGRPAEASTRLQAAGDEGISTKLGWPLRNFLSHMLLVHLEQGELGQPVEDILRRYEELGDHPRRVALHAKHVYVYQAYVRLAQAMVTPTPERLEQLRDALKQLRQAGRHPSLRSHYLAIEGGLRRLDGHPDQALQRLAAAEAHASRADNAWALFEVRRQMAHTLAALDNPRASLRQARLGHRLAVEYGWTNRARWIRSEFEVLKAPSPGAVTTADELPVTGFQNERLEQHLDALLQVSLAASSTRDPAQQAQLALDETIRVLNAQRAFLFACTEQGELELRAGRSSDGTDLAELTGYSRTVVETVRTSCEALVLSGSEEGEILSSDSIIAHDLRSIVAAPLLMRGRLLGVVYLDSQLAYGAFTPEDVTILLAIANHIALALASANALTQQAVLTRANSDLLNTLRQRVDELQESRRQITAAEERLRREIAEMLHSRVQSKLLVAAHQLARIEGLLDSDPPAARRLLSSTQVDLDEIREREIRQASHLLHPSIIGVGLVPAVRSLIGRFQDFFRVSLEVAPNLAKLDSIVDNKLSEELRLTAYRGIEEALGNISRHARASLAEVGLSLTTANELLIEVHDNGRGFDGAELKPGLGLHSIAGRVGQLGGTWHIASRSGEGTTLTISLPIAASGGAASLRDMSTRP